MYVRSLDGQVLDFRHRGWLLDQSFLFFDEKTDSLWSQASGTAVLGPMKGRSLKRLPVTHTTWGQWKRREPATLVLEKPRERLERYRSDSYAEYYRRNDVRFGLAVCLPAGQRLYPLDELTATPVVNDAVGDLPIVVVFHAPSGTAVAYSRAVAGATIRFRAERNDAADVVIADPASGRRWSGLTGKPVDGSAPALEPIVATQFVVRNFRAHFPAGEVYTTRQ